ncbi:MAG: hypothetical protein WCD70_01420, partial [Alphaproteobacteria bacterium]
MPDAFLYGQDNSQTPAATATNPLNPPAENTKPPASDPTIPWLPTPAAGAPQAVAPNALYPTAQTPTPSPANPPAPPAQTPNPSAANPSTPSVQPTKPPASDPTIPWLPASAAGAPQQVAPNPLYPTAPTTNSSAANPLAPPVEPAKSPASSAPVTNPLAPPVDHQQPSGGPGLIGAGVKALTTGFGYVNAGVNAAANGIVEAVTLGHYSGDDVAGFMDQHVGSLNPNLRNAQDERANSQALATKYPTTSMIGKGAGAVAAPVAVIAALPLDGIAALAGGGGVAADA